MGIGPLRHWIKVRKAWQDLKSRALNKLTFNHNLTGNSSAKAKTLTKWEHRITDFLADLSLIAGMSGGFETGIMLLSQQEESEQLHADALNDSSDMFSQADSVADDDDMFSMNLSQFAAYLHDEKESAQPQDSDSAGETKMPENSQEQQEENTAQ